MSGEDVGAVLARAAEQRPAGVVIIERDVHGDLVVAWANAAAASQLGLAPGCSLVAKIGAASYAAWEATYAERVGRGGTQIRNGVAFTGAGSQVVVELRAVLPESAFEVLLAQNVCGVFIAKLDEPIEWGPHVDREAALDYAYEHQRAIAVNDALCAQMHVGRESLLGSPPSTRWAPDREAWREHMRRLYDQGSTHHVVRAPRSDGTWLDAEGEYVCLYDALGRIAGHYGVQRDVTVPRSTAAALAKTEERLALAITAGGIAVWDIDLPSMSIYFEGAWLERLGYVPSAVPWSDPMWWSRILHPDDLPEAARHFKAHLAGKSDVFQLEHRLRTASGAWRWLQSTGRITTRNASGKPLRMVGTCLDITERKQLDARLATSERLAALGRLAASVGHEINNPLTYVLINMARIADIVDATPAASASVSLERVRPLVAEARDGAERVRGIVSDMQALSRTPEDRIAAVDPIEILERCLRIAEPEIKHRAHVVRELAPVPPISGNEGRIVQLFLNLIVNAAQSIPEGDAARRWIRATTRSIAGNRVQIEIADSGRGMDHDELEHIFEPFYTTKAAGEGTGLGLTIARSIVVAMGGEIEVATALGRGTTFTVTLPSAPCAAPLPQTSNGTPARNGKAERLRVLVIDDEVTMGRTLASVLEPHEVVVASSARAALARVESGEQFDFILCDLMMPQVTGMDFFEMLDPQLRSRVVFLTGGAFTERASRFLERVPNRVLRKPFDVDELMALLHA